MELVEIVLYVSDMKRATCFYRDRVEELEPKEVIKNDRSSD
jgi:hypothetical protein